MVIFCIIGSLALYENDFMSCYTIDSDLWLLAIVVFVYLAVLSLGVAYKRLHYHVREKRKEERSKQATHHVYDMDYHRICKSQTHFCKDYVTIKRANSELTKENRKLRQELADKVLALEQMTKKWTNLKREVHIKDEKLKYGKQERKTLEDELSQLQEEFIAIINYKENEIRQHEEALKTVIEHVMSDLDDLCTIHNESLGQNETNPQIQCHLPSGTQPGVFLPTPLRYVYYH